MNDATASPWSESMPRYWCAGDAFETRFLEAMSLLAPEVERFVIGAVRDSLPALDDEGLARACKAFIREESEHSRVHHAFNRRLEAQGIDVLPALAQVRSATGLALRRLSPGGRLAVAAACEHLSALMSLAYLRAERKAEILSPHTVRLFDGHARDELGHRAFVYDLMCRAGGAGWFSRALALLAVSLVGVSCALQAVDVLLKHDAPRRRATLWWRGALRVLGPRRWVSVHVLLQGWLTYLRPGFHPSDLPDD